MASVGTDPVLVQQTLDICQQWSAENLLDFRLTKCGTTSPIPFTLGNNCIPQVKSYDYLGVPWRQTGYDWVTFLRRSLNKARATLDFFRRCGDLLSTRQRLNVYKIFVRSCHEYALPLVSACKGISVRSYQVLDEMFQSALKWIFEGATQRFPLLTYLAGLATPIRRVRELEIQFGFALQQLHVDNPLLRLRRVTSPLSFLGRLFQQGLRSNYTRDTVRSRLCRERDELNREAAGILGSVVVNGLRWIS